MRTATAALLALIPTVLVQCAYGPTPPDRVVLLPAADGSVGAIVVGTEAAATPQRLDTAYASASVDSRGRLVTGTLDASAVRQDYAAALAAQPPRPVSITLYFESGSASEFIAASRPVLDQLKKLLADYPAPQVMVIGHTDRVGTLPANDLLSRKRAETVRDQLVEAGIPAERLEVAGRGEREPLVPTADEVAEEKNRRVEITVR